MLTPEELKIVRRAAKIKLARDHFWDFCKVREPDFYRDDRWHLKLLCYVLNLLYYRQLTKETFRQVVLEIAPAWFYDIIKWDKIKSDHIFMKLLMNLPPQHGKSRTLVNFEAWAFGKNTAEKVINGSYNNEAAKDFSRYTRDAIQEKSNDPDDIVYSDIFPETKIKRGNAAYGRWALDGQHFSYQGAGIGGTLTGKGGTILVVDDPIKDAETALNPKALDRVWTWYSGTFISRVSAEGGEPLEIINHTRWAKKDVCGRILDSDDGENWLVLSMPAINSAGEMLCPSLLSRKRYEFLERIMVPAIRLANYENITIDTEGQLFPPEELRRFTMNEIAGKTPDAVIAFGDIADQGTDFLSVPIGYKFGDNVFLADVVFTPESVEYTQPETTAAIMANKCRKVCFESNGGGRIFAVRIQEMLREKGYYCDVNWRASTVNKETRILMQVNYIKQHFLFREDYQPGSAYDLFMQWLCSYVKGAKNEHDDAPDSLAGLADFIQNELSNEFFEQTYV